MAIINCCISMIKFRAIAVKPRFDLGPIAPAVHIFKYHIFRTVGRCAVEVV